MSGPRTATLAPICCATLLCALAIAGNDASAYAEEANASAFSVQRDLTYAEAPAHERHRLDLYMPKDRQPAGIVIWIHGGGWQRGDKSRMDTKPEAICGAGFALAAINYRFVPEVTFREQAADVAAATAWVIEQESLNAAKDHVFLMGHSAGAHLAALVAADGKYLAAQDMSPGDLAGIVLLDGAGYDLPARRDQSADGLGRFFENVFGKDEAAMREASPAIQALDASELPPFLIFHVAGRVDARKQSHWLAEAIHTSGNEARVVPASGKTHGTINREFGQPNDEVTRLTLDFLTSGKVPPVAAGG